MQARTKLARAWRKVRGTHAQAAAAAVRILSSWETGHASALSEAPFDAQLLRLSPLYRRSRASYLATGGSFTATLVSSPRSLSSIGLLSPRIEYSPIEREMIWSATDPIERRSAESLLRIRGYVTSLFHEQSHRLLWKLLPPSAKSPAAIRRYLNLAESLVVIADMALGDELGPDLASMFHLTGVTYDPGTNAKASLKPRPYRNYLQAALHATYLTLELYDPRDIVRWIPRLHSHLGDVAARSARRAVALDRKFVEHTNPTWQDRHRSATRVALTRADRRGLVPLELTASTEDFRLGYLWGEHWMDALGIGR